jgi:hypothetical protein
MMPAYMARRVCIHRRPESITEATGSCKECRNQHLRQRTEEQREKKRITDRQSRRKADVKQRRSARRKDSEREYDRSYRRKKKYGLTQADVDRLRVDQGDACLICKQPFDGVPHIDHDHTTNLVRGLLCKMCNLGLGFFKDDSARLRSAIKYLASSNESIKNVT